MNARKMVAVTAVLAACAIVVSPAEAKGKKGGGEQAPAGPKVEAGKTVGKAPDMSKPVKVFIIMGQSNAVGMGKIASLQNAVQNKKLYPYLVDDEGKWASRADVRYVRVMSGRGGGMQVFNNEPLTVDKCKTIGVEFGAAKYLGDAIDAPVMILKSCIGNRSLGWDLLPPGSEPYNGEPGYRGTKANLKGNGEKVQGEWYAGKQYDDDTEYAKAVLADLNKYYPGAKSAEVAGFFFWQGEKDHGNPNHMNNYEKNLVQFIKALRKDFNAPDAKFVCGTLGESAKGSGDKVMEACFAVDGNSGKYPAFKGNVAAVYTHDMAQGGSGNGHYNGNAEVYMNVGEAMGKAMVELLKSK